MATERSSDTAAPVAVQMPAGSTSAMGFNERHGEEPILHDIPMDPAPRGPEGATAAVHPASPPATVASAPTEEDEIPPNTLGQWRMSVMTHFYLLRVVCFLTFCTGLAYLGWKTAMVSWHITRAGATCIIFLCSELLVFLCSLMLMLEVSVPARERPPMLIPDEGPFPSVSIFICCCKESLDVIQDTVRAALAQKYPPERYIVWVLDDGGDDSLKAWVEGESIETAGRVRYVRRPKPKGVPHHFKAGNINWGLRQAGGDFVVILDADMILSKFYIASVLPHFTSTDIAFVQCPQAFYNIVKGDPLNDSSLDFYDVFLPYRDGRDSAQCVGTGVCIRKEVLRENHGFTTGSITEDFDTAMSFHSRGYKTVYINQRLQAGLAPWTLEGYIKQHQRWATGSLQILFHRNPLCIRDRRFSLYRRISYWYAGVQYYMNVVVMLILIMPIVILAFDLRIMIEAPPTYVQRLYILLLVPYVTSSRLLCMCLFSRLRSGMMVQMRGEQVWYWMAPFNCIAILRFFFPSKHFKSTGSSNRRPTVWSRLSTVWFHIAFCVVAIGVVAWKFSQLEYRDCGKLLKVTSWAPFIIFGVQNMMVPVLYQLNAPNHPKVTNRRQMLTYDENGVPRTHPDQLYPESDPRLYLFYLVPGLWFIGILFYFYVAIADIRPSFCTKSGFFDYDHF